MTSYYELEVREIKHPVTAVSYQNMVRASVFVSDLLNIHMTGQDIDKHHSGIKRDDARPQRRIMFGEVIARHSDAEKIACDPCQRTAAGVHCPYEMASSITLEKLAMDHMNLFACRQHFAHSLFSRNAHFDASEYPNGSFESNHLRVALVRSLFKLAKGTKREIGIRHQMSEASGLLSVRAKSLVRSLENWRRRLPQKPRSSSHTRPVN